MKYDILTVLDICADLVVDLGDTVPEFGQKEKYVDDFALDMGGSTCIFACQCAKLGLKTTGAGVIGGDAFGQLVIETLKNSGIDISNIIKSENIKTGLGLHLMKRGDDRSILTYSGSIGAVTPEQITDELLKSTRHLHIGSYYLLDGIRDKLPDILRCAKNFGLTTSLDTNWDPSEQWQMPDEIFANIDIFLPNYNEALILSGCPDIHEALIELAKKVPVVAIKMGADGGLAAGCGDQFKLPAIQISKTDIADTIGAGDNFDAGFIYAWLKDLPLMECLRAGLYCGSVSIKKPGGIAGQISCDHLLKYLKI